MYLYDLHQHTKDGSACGIDDPVSIVRACARDGWAGFVLTDHFIHGNTRVRRNMPWADIVRAYERSYETAYEEGVRLGVDVIFGIEEGIGDGKEVLLYGITPAWLYDHPELQYSRAHGGGLPLIAALAREAGALVVQAHPYRVRDYIPRPWEEIDLSLVDGIEVHNACNTDMENLRAWRLAEQHDLLMTAGSDAHTADFPARAGIAVERRIRDAAALAATLRDGDYELYIGE